LPEITAPLRAPELAGGVWVQGPPTSLAFCRGAVALLEFWEATCVNCLRTLPYVAEWHRRYAARGLVVIGVHTPEFEATRPPEVVAAAVAAEGVPYPVLLDAGAETWQRFANKYWPARYLVDARGYLRYEHFGEGAYGETEEWIQRLLREAGDEGPFPEPMAPLRPEDRCGAVCARPTAELHLGYHRGRMMGPQPYRPEEEVSHPWSWTAAPPVGVFTPRGRWVHGAEYLECRRSGAEVEVVCEAAGVGLVAQPPADGEGRLVVELVEEGGRRRALPGELAGEDVERWDGAAGVRWGRVRLLRLVRGGEFARRRLVVRVETVGARLFAVSFTGCVVG
jgi:thiol-disulfide isomerase/thioredoxin